MNCSCFVTITKTIESIPYGTTCPKLIVVYLITKDLLPAVKAMSDQERGALYIHEELVKNVNGYLGQRDMPEGRKKEFMDSILVG